MADLPTGHLIKMYRISRKKSIVNVATHAGITSRYLEMVEAGSKTPTLPTLRRIATVLGVRTSSLVGDAPSSGSHDDPVNPMLAAVERALFAHYVNGSGIDFEISELAMRISSAWERWFLSPTRYSDVLTLLPDLIADVECSVKAHERSREICRLASELYALVRPVLKHGGRADLGLIVSDRIMRYAEESGDPLLIAAAKWNLGQALLSNDMSDGALDLALSTADQLVSKIDDDVSRTASLYGALLQVGAIASVRTGDPWRGRELLRGPARRAAQNARGNDFHTLFGPTNLSIHVVSVEFEAGEITEALRLADDVDISSIPSLERRTSHLFQVARCYDLRNNDTAVFVHLRMAEKLCPQDFRYKKSVREMVGSLVRRAKPSYALEVREFAEKIGLLD